uniref:Mediator of RNA polymerase II transcription subunit 8 n=3 Tax=Lygus hesperus TaxID=30085 RepID=A0A0A9W294_LYGHE
MQREEKQLELALEAISLRVNELKNSIGAMIFKLENESDTMNWPSFLDNYALLSGQLVSISKMLGHDKCPALRNYAVLPLLLSPERDEQLLRLTEHRVPMFSHDLVPDYLRTKPIPEVEQKMVQLEHKATSLSYETIQKQMSAYSKVVGQVWELVSKAREEWETESSSRAGSNITSSLADTHSLVAAIATGKSLKGMGPGGMPPNMIGAPGRPVAGGAMNPSQMQQQMGGPMGKVPSGIKTNIKAANQMHPYAR